MKHALLLLLSFLPVTACAAPVQVSLRASAGVTANSDGFWTLAQVADFSGGTADQQKTLAAVVVGRVPLAGETRTLTRGDVCLKLRQAGLRPGTDAVVGGAGQLVVTAEVGPPGPPSLGGGNIATLSLPSLYPIIGAGGPSVEPLVHTGDPVLIVVQDGPLSITARGEARQPGAAGQTIRVHRMGVMTDLRATVIDSQTVQLEI